MLLAVVLGVMLGITGKILIQQWLTGALSEAARKPSLSPLEFPRLAPSARSARTRPTAPRALPYGGSPLRRAA